MFGVQHNRRTVRAEVNPLDVSTIVSILPKQVDETKCTIQPGRFIIPPGSVKNPSILVVGSSSWWRDINEEEPLLEIPVPSIVVAQSVVRDYCNGILACDMSSRMPGLFFLPGRYDLNEIKDKYQNELSKAHILQNNWFSQLVKMGDALWARSGGNSLAIDDWMKLAAKELGLEKEWTKNYTMQEMSRCPACGHVVDPRFPICGNCKHIINPGAAKKLGFQPAELK